MSERLVLAGKVVGALLLIAGALWAALTWGVEVDAAPEAIHSLEARHKADTDTILGHIDAHHDSLVNKSTVDTLHVHIHAIRVDQQHQRQIDSIQNAHMLEQFEALRCQMRGETGC